MVASRPNTGPRRAPPPPPPRRRDADSRPAGGGSRNADVDVIPKFSSKPRELKRRKASKNL
jgi:hypothetical protein